MKEIKEEYGNDAFYIQYGTGVLGGLAAYPIAKLLMGLEPAGFTVYMLPFFISTAAGSVLAFVLLKILEKSHVLHTLEA